MNSLKIENEKPVETFDIQVRGPGHLPGLPNG